MSITMIKPLQVGNAIRLWVSPPSTSLRHRILRNLTGVFADESDPGATIVYEGDDTDVLDDSGLINGTEYFYRSFYYDGAIWSASSVVSATPSATYQDNSTDVLSVVRDRLDSGIKVEIARSALQPKSSRIQVLNAPPLAEDNTMPVISVHVDQDGSQERVLANDLSSDFATDAGINVDEGYLSNWRLTVIGWCLNPDERIAIRKSIKRVLLANLPVFDAHGMVNIDFTFSDAEDFQSFNAPLYQVVCTFTCLAPSQITETVAPISDVTVDVTAVDAVIGA